MRLTLTILLTAFLAVSFSQPTDAALPPEVKKQLSEMLRELRPVSSMVRKKQIDEAKAIIAKIEEQVGELNIAEDERDRSYTALNSALQRAKLAIPVSFESEVAPIIKGKCIRCHGVDQVCAELDMTSYANMGKGGQGGPLLIPRNPQRSLIMARLTANGQGRMPRGGQKLSDDEINIIGRWIASGAAFDGEDMTAAIGESMAEKKPPKPKVKVVMADGSETVSFKDDVAPWMVNVCLRCHSGNNPRGGYNISTFEQLLAGGDTGNTVVPGDPDGSYIVDLVLRQDPIKMPAGNQTRIKRSEAQALAKWISEGAHFDGNDPKAPLRGMVPTVEELEAAKLAAMSDSEFADRRTAQAESLWKRVAPREEATASKTDSLYVYGNVPQSRLDEMANWGEAQVASLVSKYNLPGGSKPWRGRLIVFVSKTRFDYEEFNTVLLNRRTPRGVSGHMVITPNFDTAYIVMFDGGDADSADFLNSQQLLNSLLAQAYLGREGTTFPDWLRQGFGLMESGAGQESQYFKLLPQKAGEALSTVTNAATLFDDGTFSPEEVGPVGFLLTRFLLNRGGKAKLGQLAKQLQTSRNASRAVQAVYGQNAASLGQAFLSSGGR